jgi:hypothetical protein
VPGWLRRGCPDRRFCWIRCAGTFFGRRQRGLLTRWLVGDLNENFVLLDHADLEARTLLDRIVALLEVANFGIHPGVAPRKLFVGFPLLLQLPIDVHTRNQPPLPSHSGCCSRANTTSRPTASQRTLADVAGQ